MATENDNITRDEFKSEIGRIEGVLGTQIGAVEAAMRDRAKAVEKALAVEQQTLNAKLSSLRAWGVAALVGGQVAAGLLAALVGPSHAYHSALHVLHYV